MHRQTVDRTPMLAPVWMHYPDDSATQSIDAQFFFGPSVLVSPVTQEDATSVTFYLPNDVFYDFSTMGKVNSSGSNVTYSDVPFTDIPT
jgi:alpha-glucosidase